MKRISLFVALAVLTPSLCQGYVNTVNSQPHFNSYAFSYHHSGLVPAGLGFSSYALSYDHSGLVYRGTRYSSYALSYHNPGLVADYAYRPAGASVVVSTYRAGCNAGVPAPGPTRRRTVLTAEQRRQKQQADGMYVIRQYLAKRQITDARMSYYLGTGNGTGGVTFILRDKDLAIRYRNPELLEAAGAEADHKQAVIDRHEQYWTTFAQDFEARGGTIYEVAASDAETILAALDACTELNDADGSPGTPTLYAKD